MAFPLKHWCWSESEDTATLVSALSLQVWMKDSSRNAKRAGSVSIRETLKKVEE